MRVPTLNTSQNAFAGIQARQADQARLQTQLGSALRVNSPGDDPVAAAQGELARSRLAHIAQDQRTTQLATSLLSAADGALTNGVDLLQSVRENLVGAGDGSFTDTDRQALALSLRSARERLVALANTSDGAGGYVFAGQGSAGAPLSSGVNPAWLAPGGQQAVGAQQSSGGRQLAVSLDGSVGFMAQPQGNGVFVTASAAANTGTGWIDPGTVANPSQLTGHSYAITVAGTAASPTWSVSDLTDGTPPSAPQPLMDGAAIVIDGQSVKISGAPAPGDSFNLAPAGRQSVFATLDSAIAAMEKQPFAPGAYAEQLQRAQTSLDRALDGFVQMRSAVGMGLQQADSASAAADQDKVTTTHRKSGLVDLDFAAALSSQATNQVALQAALKTYANVAGTSLFQLIN